MRDTSFTRGDLRLTRFLRARPPFEEWSARLVDLAGVEKEVVVRRALPGTEGGAAAQAHLRTGSDIARRVAHQNVLQCLGIFESGDQVVQLLEPTKRVDLAQLIRLGRQEEAPFEISMVVWVTRQACEALAHAHALGIVHRGLSPSSIFLTAGGVVKVDFGLVTGSTAEASHDSTQHFDVKYAAPEEMGSGDAIDERTDVYSLGCLAWELLTGDPYKHALSSREAEGEVPASMFRAEVPSDLDRCLNLALRKVPGERIPDARAFHAFLTRIFYAGLDADDDPDGRNLLKSWVARALPEAPTIRPTGPGSEPTLQMRGKFTEMLEARVGPVQPRDFTTEDVDQESREDGSWAPGMQLENQMAEARRTQDDTGGEDRGERHPVLQARDDSESARETVPSEPPARPLGRSAWLPMPIWGLVAGFLMAFSLLVALRALFF